jgi:hypothetical protein
MSDRERLDRRSGWVMIPAVTGLLLFSAAVVVSQAGWSPALAVVGLPGIALAFIASVIGHTVAFRCSTCRGNLAPLAFAYPSWRFNPRVLFCPYCAADLDAELTSATELIAAEPFRTPDGGEM